jgi:hypothetical protein
MSKTATSGGGMVCFSVNLQDFKDILPMISGLRPIQNDSKGPAQRSMVYIYANLQNMHRGCQIFPDLNLISQIVAMIARVVTLLSYRDRDTMANPSMDLKAAQL